MNELESLRKFLEERHWFLDSWFLLSALRGPDSNDYELKERTTWRIRSAICESYFIPSRDFGEPDKGTYDEIYDRIKKEFPDAQDHFVDHYSKACVTYWYLREAGQGEIK